jgi:hypothetical protein
MSPSDQPGHTETIDLDNPEQVRRWMNQLGVDERRLRELVERFGPVADRVAWHLMQERGLVKGDPTPDS